MSSVSGSLSGFSSRPLNNPFPVVRTLPRGLGLGHLAVFKKKKFEKFNVFKNKSDRQTPHREGYQVEVKTNTNDHVEPDKLVIDRSGSIPQNNRKTV